MRYIYTSTNYCGDYILHTTRILLYIYHKFQGGIQTASGAHLVNGAFSTPSFASDNYQPQGPYDVANAGEDLVERFRMEAKLEMERERQKALERQLLMNRQPPPPVAVSPHFSRVFCRADLYEIP